MAGEGFRVGIHLSAVLDTPELNDSLLGLIPFSEDLNDFRLEVHDNVQARKRLVRASAHAQLSTQPQTFERAFQHLPLLLVVIVELLPLLDELLLLGREPWLF